MNDELNHAIQTLFASDNNSFYNIATIEPVDYQDEHCNYIDPYYSNLTNTTTNLNYYNNLLLTGILQMNNINVQQFYLTFNNTKLTKEKLTETYNYMLAHNDAKINLTNDTYKLTTVYVNELEEPLDIPGFTLENKAALYACFKNIRLHFKEQEETEIIENVVIDKIYIKQDTKELIRIVNYAISKAPTRTSNIDIIAGNRFKQPEVHVLLALLPILFKDVTKTLCSEELELFKLYTDPYTINTTTARNRLTSLLALDKYKSLLKKKKYEQLKARYIEYTVSSYDRRINDIQNKIEDMTLSLKKQEEILTKTNMEKLYYYNNKNTDDLEYLINHPYLETINLYGSDLSLTVRVPLTVWDPEEATIIASNLDNLIEDYGIKEYADLIKFFFKEVLLKQTAVYWMNSNFTLNIANFDYMYRQASNVIDLYKLLQESKAGYNPHIERYRCTGSHKTEINKAIQSRQLIAVFEALLNPIKNWNLSDGAVLGEALRNMFPLVIKKNIKCLQYDKEMYSLQELYTILNKECKENVKEECKGDVNE